MVLGYFPDRLCTPLESWGEATSLIYRFLVKITVLFFTDIQTQLNSTSGNYFWILSGKKMANMITILNKSTNVHHTTLSERHPITA